MIVTPDVIHSINDEPAIRVIFDSLLEDQESKGGRMAAGLWRNSRLRSRGCAAPHLTRSAARLPPFGLHSSLSTWDLKLERPLALCNCMERL